MKTTLRIRGWAPALAAGAVLLALPARAQRELLRDGDFEKSGASSSPGWTHVWPPAFRPEPKFSYPKSGAHAGARCAEIAVEFAGGFSSLTQELDLPKKLGWLRLSAAARIEEQSGGGSAWLALIFVGRDSDDSDLRQTRHLNAVGDWETLALEAAVPAGTTRLVVRCGVFGPARARFDDVSLSGGEGELPRTDVTLAVAHSYWRVTAEDAVDDPWIEVSVPMPFAAQTPLALRVDSEPAARVAQLSVVAERDNRLLRVQLERLDAGASVKLHVRTLTLVRKRELADGKDVDLVALPRVPADVREHLERAPGIESDDPRVQRIARGLERGDLGELVADLFDFLRREISAGGGDQGALATLESKDAACTGHANLGAALMIAAGVPTRVLACVLVGAEQEEHYVIEAWTRELGWSRVETAIKLFPVPDATHLILRVVHPDSPRSSANVPVFWRLAEGLGGGFDSEPLAKGLCWQSAREVAQLALDRAGVDALESAARPAFEALVDAPRSGDAVRFAPKEAPAAVAQEIERFLTP